MDRLALDVEATERILTDFLRDECTKAGFSKAVVGLSGGIDSAVVCHLVATALGPEHVTAVMMPARSSSPASLADARIVAKATGVPSRIIEIGDMADGLLKMVPEASALRKGNVFARCRMIALYDVSAEVGGLVIGTSNKSERLLGYGTMFGDLACAINPIGELYKTQVRALAAHLGVAESVRTKAPSADLWEGQSDEEELGASYETFDRLLVRMIDDGLTEVQLVAEGFAADFVRDVDARIRANRFKGRMPVIATLDGR